MSESLPATNVAEDRCRRVLAKTAADQRKHRRHCCGKVTLTRLSLPATETPMYAWVHDISETGIGLDVLNPLPAGAELVFELKRDKKAI